MVIAGAGIAGVSTAYHLMVRRGMRDVTLVDPRAPLTLTSDKSTECYRNFWPTRPMVALMNRSIDLLEEFAVESGNVFALNRRGYLYVTADEGRLMDLAAQANVACELGAGPVRIHDRAGSVAYVPSGLSDWRSAPEGFDLLLSGDRLREAFPFLTEDAVGGLHARRAGWLSAQQYGAWMLDQARERGLRFLRGAVDAVDARDGRIVAVAIDGASIPADVFVNAAGPYLPHVGRLLGLDLPVRSELHLKLSYRDVVGALPRAAPMTIWFDPQRLSWDPEEITLLEQEDLGDLAGPMPGGCHTRPEGGADSPWALALWEYRKDVMDPIDPPPAYPLYDEVVLRGTSTMIPALRAYQDHLPRSVVDGGYYTKTVENRPLVGPIGPTGSYVLGALSGFGIMASAGAAELLADHITGAALPAYAPAFDPNRYDDPDYLATIDLSANGQI